MDEFPKSMVIKLQINSNFYNNVIFKFDYVCEYFNHDKGQSKGCKTKIDEYYSIFQILVHHWQKHCDAPKNKPKFGVLICTKDHLDNGPRTKTLRTNLKQIEP
jgi:hypothetical protein